MRFWSGRARWDLQNRAAARRTWNVWVSGRSGRNNMTPPPQPLQSRVSSTTARVMHDKAANLGCIATNVKDSAGGRAHCARAHHSRRCESRRNRITKARGTAEFQLSQLEPHEHALPDRSLNAQAPGELRPHRAQTSGIALKDGRNQAKLSERRPNLTRLAKSESRETGRFRASFGRIRANIDRNRPHFDLILGDVGMSLTNADSNSFEQLRAMLTECCPRLAKLSPTQ